MNKCTSNHHGSREFIVRTTTLWEKKKEKPFLTIKSPKNSIFPKRGLTHAFGPKNVNFSLFVFGQNKTSNSFI